MSFTHGHVGMGIERGCSVIFTSCAIHYHSTQNSVKSYDFQAILCAMIEPSNGEDMKKIQEPLSAYCILVFCRTSGVPGNCGRCRRFPDKTPNYL